MLTVHEQLKMAFYDYLKQVEEFETKGKKVAAVRARKALQEMKTLIAARRQEIQHTKTSCD
jgi:hypothetical protein